MPLYRFGERILKKHPPPLKKKQLMQMWVAIASEVQVIFFSASFAPPPVQWVTEYLSHQESVESQTL